HRAGADFVLSYATMGASIVFNMLRRSDVLLLAEGLDVFRIHMPKRLVGRTLANSGIRPETGCNVVAVCKSDGVEVNPDAHAPLPADAELIVIGDIEAENKFMTRFAEH